MEPIYKTTEIYFWDYEKIHSTIMNLHLRYNKIRGISVSDPQFKTLEMEHIKVSLAILNCEFFRRYKYEPIFPPT